MPTLAPQPPRKEKGGAEGRPEGRPEGRARGGKPNGKPNGKASGSHGHASGSLAPAPRTSPQKGTSRPTNGPRPAPGLPTPGGKAGGASALKTPSPSAGGPVAGGPVAGSPAEETPLAELPVIWLTGRNAIPYPFHFRKDARTLHPVTDPGVLAALSAKKDARGLSLSKAVSIAVAHAFNGAETCTRPPTALLSPVPGGRLAREWMQSTAILKGHWFSPAELKTMQLKWVTAHPNGPGTEGKPILVHDNGDSYTVVGGAGGSMNQMVLDKSKTKAPDEQKALRQAGAEKRKAAAQALKEKDPAAFEKIVQAKKLYTAKVKSATAAYRAEALKTMGVNIDAVVTKARTEAATQAMKADPKATPEEVKAHADKAEASVVSQAHAAVDSALRGALDAVARARINQEAPTSQDVTALVAGTEIVKKLSPADLKALMTKATSLDQIKTVQRALQKAMRTGKAEHALGLDLNILDKAPTDAEVNKLVTDGYLGRRGVKLQTALVKESHRASPEAAVHHEALGAMDGLNAYTQATGADAVITPELATKLDARGLARVAAAHLLDKHADAKALAVDLEKKLADRSDLHAAAALNLCAQLHHLGVGAVHAAQGADGSVTMVSAHQAQMDNAAKAAQVANLARGQIRAASELHNLLVAPDPSPLELLSAASPIAAKAQARAMGLDTGDFTVEASGDGHKVMVKAAAIGKLAHPAAATDPDRARRMAELKQEVAHPEHGAWRSPNLAPGVTLAPHQQLWAQAIINEKRVAGNQGAGSGKTAVYYAALDHLLSTGAISKALMTMPAKPRSQQEDYRARAAAGDVGAKEQAKAKGTPEEWRPDPTDASFLVSDKTGEKRKFLTGKGAEAFHVVENTAALADHLKAAKAGEKRVLIMSPEMMRDHEAELEAAGFGKPDSAYFPDEAHELTQTPAEVAAAERGKITSHKAQAAERIAKGSGYFAPGCVDAATLLHDPVRGITLTFEEWRCRGWRPFVTSLVASGDAVVARASVPFVKAHAPMFDVVTAGGRTVRVAGGHLFLTPAGWVRLDRLQAGAAICCATLSAGPSDDPLRAHDPNGWHTPLESGDRCNPSARRRGGPLRSAIGDGQSPAPLPAGVRARNRLSWRAGDGGSKSGYTRTCHVSGRPATRHCAAQVAPPTCAPAGCRSGPDTSGSFPGAWAAAPVPVRDGELSQDRNGLPLPAPQSRRERRAGATGGRCACGSLPSSLWDLVTRIIPAGTQAVYDITVPGTANYLAHGIWHHNSGTFLSTGPADVYGILHLTDPTAFPRDGAAAFSAEWSRAAEAGQDAMFGPEATSRLAQRVNPYMVSYHAPVTAKDPATGATHELHQAHKVERVPLTADQTTAMAAVNKKYEQDRVSPDPKVRAGASFVRYAGLSKAMAGAPMYAAMQQMLTDSVARDPSFKPVIWSQGLESLDELEKRLTKAGHKVVRVDGSTGTAAVQAAMHAFNEGDARVLLVSNAGNFGLNAQGGREIWKVGSPDTAAKDTQLDHRVDRNGQTQDTVSRTFIGKHQLAEAALQHLAVRSRQLALLGEIGRAGRQAAATDDSGRAAAIAAHLPAIAAAAGVSAGQQQAQAIAKALAKAFDPTEPRDPGGKWTQEVYHGTGRAFGTFAEAPPASVTGNPTAGWGHFFTPTRGEAARYVKDFSGGKGRVIAARLNLQNPYVMSYGEHKRFTDPDEWTDAGMAKKRVEADAFKQELLAEGYDGIIIGRGAYQEFVAFHPHQISVTGEDVMKAYSPSEARDPAGRWTDSGAPAMGPHLPPLAHEPSMHDLAAGTAHGYEAVADASRHLLKERIEKTPHLHLTWGEVAHGAKHLAGEIKEKVDIRETFKALKALGKQHGPAFLAYAIAIEAFEDVVVPAILTSIGKPYLIPVALAVHTEPIMYPLYFAVSKFMKQRKARRLAGIPLTREQIGKALWAAMAPRQALAFGRAP